MAPPPPPPTATAHHDNQSDSISTTSAASTPRSSNYNSHNDPRLRFMCSFGGKIIPRPHDNQLRYVGGDTRIIAINRHTTFAALLAKLAKTVGTVVSYNNLTVKYQLPNEDLDALISVSNDEDVENMMDEYDRVGSKTGRLRLFLFDEISRTTSISSILNGSMKRESWFFDALNGGGGSMGGGGAVLERGFSEASSIVSEVPDYLFGLDNSDDPVKTRTRSNLADCISNSDPGSPAPVISSSASTPPPYFSSPLATTIGITAAATQMVPNLASVKTIVETVSTDPPVSVPSGLLQSNTMWQYNPDPNYPGQIQTPMTTSFQPVPVYYIPAPAQPGNYPIQPGPIRTQFVQKQQQIPIGYHPAGTGMGMGMVPVMGQIHGVPNGAMLRPIGVGLESYDGVNHIVPGYYGQQRQQQVHVYPAGNVSSAGSAGVEDHTRSGSDTMGSGAGQ